MLVYLKPLSIFPELHSDTLFGAITYAIAELYPDKVQQMLTEFEEYPPFLISSTFPFAFAEDKKIRFYPKLIAKQSADDKYNPQNYKDFKKVKFIEEELFFKMINGELSNRDILKNYDKYSRNKYLLSNEKLDIDVSYGDTIIPNNSINRVTNETEGIFYTSGKQFKNLGLFFAIEFNNDEYIPLVKAAILFLRDRGFGRDISNGKGQFDFEIDESYSLFEKVQNISGDSFVTLSRFVPTKEDLSKINEYSTYELGSKRGKSSSGEIRKQIRFFEEGSIFPNYKEFYGKLVQSGKDSPAIEYGFAFPIKCISNKGGII